jgi:hypothetical protein
VPPGVAVSVDGEHTGMTPLDMVLLVPGRHEIRMDREGLRPWVKEVDARIGESFAVEARLQPVDTGSAAGWSPRSGHAHLAGDGGHPAPQGLGRARGLSGGGAPPQPAGRGDGGHDHHGDRRSHRRHRGGIGRRGPEPRPRGRGARLAVRAAAQERRSTCASTGACARSSGPPSS